MIQSPFLELYIVARMQACEQPRQPERPRKSPSWGPWLAQLLIRVARKLEGDVTRSDWSPAVALTDGRPLTRKVSS
jgi:hypothetical protein